MPPRLKIKGPHYSSPRVSYSTEHIREDGKEVHKFSVVLRLPKAKLQHFQRPIEKPTEVPTQSDSESELSLLDDELNRALSSALATSPMKMLGLESFGVLDPELLQASDTTNSVTWLMEPETTPSVATNDDESKQKPEQHPEIVNDQTTLDPVSESDDDIIFQSDVPILPPPPPISTHRSSLRTRLQTTGNVQPLAHVKSEFQTINKLDIPQGELKGYRNIPQPYLALMKRELSLFTDSNDDDLHMIQKVIFSLKDPYSGTKIRLPIKLTSCKHFECFDFDTFCMINTAKIPPMERARIRKELCLKNFEARKLEKLFQEQQRLHGGKLLSRIKLPTKPPTYTYPQFSEHGQMFHFPVYNKTPPLFKCPVCDQLFGIKQLYISDVFNYFVKTTPKTVERIELLDMQRFRIIDSTIKTSASPGPSAREEIILLSDESDSDDDNRPSSNHDDNSNSNHEDEGLAASDALPTALLDELMFDDGLDQMLLALSNAAAASAAAVGKGAGSWDDPVTLD